MKKKSGIKKTPYSKLSKSGKYYRKNKQARANKKKYDTKLNATASQKKKRAELGRARTKAKKKYGKAKIKGKDLAHTKNGLRLKSIKKNRGSKSDAAGDRRARGKKKK